MYLCVGHAGIACCEETVICRRESRGWAERTLVSHHCSAILLFESFSPQKPSAGIRMVALT